MNKILRRLSTFLFCIILLVPSITVLAGDYLSNSFQSASNLKIYLTGDTTIGKYAFTQWNNVSSKVKITETTVLSDADITLDCNRLTPTDNSLLGITLNVTGADGYYDVAYCYQYKNSALVTDTNKKATATHEVGHALSLNEQNLAVYGNTIMKQGVKNYCVLNNYDKTTLQGKWGN